MQSTLFRQACSLAVLLSVCLQLMAAVGGNKNPLSEEVYQSLTSAREMLDKEEYRQAETTLTGLLRKEINPYEQALTNQMLGYVYNALGKRDLAVAAFGKALADNLLPDNVAHDLQYTIAQLLAQDEKYREALNHLLLWFKTEKQPNAEAHLLAATIYYQLQDYRPLVAHMRDAIERTDKPERSWYELLLTGYYHTEDYASAAALLEKMITLYPDRHEYWLQLAGMYQKANQPGKSMAVMELALKRGLLEEAGIMQLVRFYLNEKLPYRAALLLQEQMDQGGFPRNRDNLQLLGGSWQLARERDKAAAAFKELAELTNDPSVYYRLGYIYFLQEKWEDANQALTVAIKSGTPGDMPDAWLLLGISAYHTNELKKAFRAFNQALNHAGTKQQAQWWLDKISRSGID